MIPAAMPASSWSVPSVGDTLCVVCSLSTTGSAPYCRTVARSLASPSLKLPEIWTLPPSNDASWNAGADCTTPSSTIATEFWGGCFENDSAASLLNAVEPSSRSDRLTPHPCPPRYTAFAPLTPFPVSAAGPSWYRSGGPSPVSRPGSTTVAFALSSAALVLLTSGGGAGGVVVAAGGPQVPPPAAGGASTLDPTPVGGVPRSPATP